MTTWLTLVNIFNAIVTLFKSLFGKAPSNQTSGVEDANTAAVATLNKTGKVESEVAQKAQSDIDQGNEHASENAADRHAQLDAANGLLARARVLEATRVDGEGNSSGKDSGPNR